MLNIKRRHLDKAERDQWIRELREEGWTQRKIAGALGVNRSTVQRAQNDANASLQNSDNSTPSQNLEAIIAERLTEERQRHDEEAQGLRAELEALKNAPSPEPVIIEREKPVPSPDRKRVRPSQKYSSTLGRTVPNGTP